MTRIVQLAVALAFALSPVTAVHADPGHGKHHGERHRGANDRHRVAHCPPGLAKKDPPCVPPGQARQHEQRYGNRIGEILRVGDYAIIRDPQRYDLDRRQGWQYYRDENRIYRVDRDTRKILAILNLIEVLSN